MARKHIEYFANGAFGITLKAKNGDTSGPMFYGQKGQTLLHNVAKSFVDKITSLQGDKNYTPYGKNESIRAHAKTMLEKLRREHKRFTEPLVRKYQTFDSTNLTAITPPRDAVQAVSRMELRQFIAAQPGEKKVKIFQDALENNDEQTLGAFLEKSSLFQLLSAEIIDTGRREYLRKKGQGDILDAELAGSTLCYGIEKLTDDLSLYLTAGNEDACAIHKDLPRPGWKFQETAEHIAIKNNLLPSLLPSPSADPRPKSQIEADLKKE